MLSYWCFSAGVAIEDLFHLGVRNLVLTSGTLSPLESFAAELRLRFPVQLENPHVVRPEQVRTSVRVPRAAVPVLTPGRPRRQVSLSVLTKGYGGQQLNSSFQHRDTLTYKSELGSTLVDLAARVPHGMLVFFPSYAVLAACTRQWYEDGTMDRLSRAKHVVVEPRAGPGAFQAAVTDYTAHVESRQGAVLLAVCRGKVGAPSRCGRGHSSAHSLARADAFVRASRRRRRALISATSARAPWW